MGIAGPFARAMPSARRRRSLRMASASSSGTTGVPAGYTRSARSHSRWRPWRPAIATSPRIARSSSIWVTLRLFVHPDDGHGSTCVSGMSRDISGPRGAEQVEHVAAEAVVAVDPAVASRRRAAPSCRRGTGAGRSWGARARCARTGCDRARARRAAPLGRRRRRGATTATRSALGAIAAVGSSCRNVRRSTSGSSPAGRSRAEHLRADSDAPRLLEAEAVGLLGVRRDGGHRSRNLPGMRPGDTWTRGTLSRAS